MSKNLEQLAREMRERREWIGKVFGDGPAGWAERAHDIAICYDIERNEWKQGDAL